jgi:hypothetical protein
VTEALNSKVGKGQKDMYFYNVLPKNTKPDEEDPKRALMTSTLANVIFSNPKYRIIALKIYDILVDKIFCNYVTGRYAQNDIRVILKGGTSYTYLFEGSSGDFPFSDLDIVIYINPKIVEYERVKAELNTIVLQTISQYKRTMDHMFFLNKPIKDQFLDADTIESFKHDFNEAVKDIENDAGEFLSAFESTEFRNISSRYSFIIDHSNAMPDSVVRVEMPHFDKCECIPLRKSPLFCSHNKTIDFNRQNGSAEEVKGHFDLYRIRWNNSFVPKEQPLPNKLIRENVAADFIDISIASREDSELIDFWEHGMCVMVHDEAANMWILVPDVHTAINDLYKMLYVYECPEAKKEKRMKKYEALKHYVNTHYRF